jgi:hypothetical protein
MIKDSLVWRFWIKFKRPKDGCWEWLASKDECGYGMIKRGGYGRAGHSVMRAHILSWVLYNGPIPSGLCVLHKCDNPKCVNPEHLFLGTKADNNHDRDKKGRHIAFHGVEHPMHKLTNIDVKNIRKSYSKQKRNGVTIAKQYNINSSTLYGIVNYKIWKHI